MVKYATAAESIGEPPPDAPGLALHLPAVSQGRKLHGHGE